MTLLQATIRRALILPDFDPKPIMLQMAPFRDAVESPPAGARLGAVIALLYKREGRLLVVLAKRPMTLRNHPGQIAFPGGRHETGETFEETALRETEEEVGIQPEQITVLGQLTPVYVPPSNFFVRPFVGWHHGSRPQFVPSPDEVAEILEVPMVHFAQEENHSRFQVNDQITVPSFLVGPHHVWGATAVMLKELATRLAMVGLLAER